MDKTVLRDDVTMLINTCDKMSDIWRAHVTLLNKNWHDRDFRSLLVTDKETDRIFEGVEVFSAGDGLELPQRLGAVLPLVETEYVFITLDDYLIINEISSARIKELIEAMKKENLDFMRLYSLYNKKLFLGDYMTRMPGYDKLYKLNMTTEYAVNLYPGLWRKSFLEQTIREELNAWQYEVSLTPIAREVGAKCAANLGDEFVILNAFGKGKQFRKPARYLQKHNLYDGDRELMPRRMEWKMKFVKTIKWLFPRKALLLFRKIAIKFGHEFYSNDTTES